MVCVACKSTKGAAPCGICAAAVCKRCAQLLKKGSFALLTPLPAELSHKTYCGPCFTAKIAPALEEYEALLARAKAVLVFPKSKNEATRFLRRNEKPIKVEDGEDERDTLMKMALAAAKASFNALIDVSITSQKVRNAGYQTTKWMGVGIPTNIDPKRMPKDD